jgi:glucokinase
MESLYIGIDIGGTNTKFGLVTSKGEVVSKNSIKTNSNQDFQVYTKELFDLIKVEISKFEASHSIIAVGVGAPNANPTNGKIEKPHNLSWRTEDLVTIFKKEIGIPVFLENDANIAAIGEKVFGVAKELQDFVVVTLGTGVGVGTFLQGELYSGAHGIGSEAGHMIVGQENRECSCGGVDHLESYLSSKGIKKTTFEMLGQELRFREIKELYLNNDPEVGRAISKSAKILAKALSSITTIINPQTFILSGGVSTLGQTFCDEVAARYSELVYTPFKGHGTIQLSKISLNDGAVLGAAALAIKQSTKMNQRHR